jgi:hypothetical protein
VGAGPGVSGTTSDEVLFTIPGTYMYAHFKRVIWWQHGANTGIGPETRGRRRRRRRGWVDVGGCVGVTVWVYGGPVSIDPTFLPVPFTEYTPARHHVTLIVDLRMCADQTHVGERPAFTVLNGVHSTTTWKPIRWSESVCRDPSPPPQWCMTEHHGPCDPYWLF